MHRRVFSRLHILGKRHSNKQVRNNLSQMTDLSMFGYFFKLLMVGLSSRISLLWQLNTTRQADSWASSTCKQLYFQQPHAALGLKAMAFQQAKTLQITSNKQKRSPILLGIRSQRWKAHCPGSGPFLWNKQGFWEKQKPALPLGMAQMWAQTRSQLQHRDTHLQEHSPEWKYKLKASHTCSEFVTKAGS